MEMKRKPKFERKSGSCCRDERTTGRLQYSPFGCVSAGRSPTLFCRSKRAETTLYEQQTRSADNTIPTSVTIRADKNHHGCLNRHRCERAGRVLPTLSEEKNEKRDTLKASSLRKKGHSLDSTILLFVVIRWTLICRCNRSRARIELCQVSWGNSFALSFFSPNIDLASKAGLCLVRRQPSFTQGTPPCISPLTVMHYRVSAYIIRLRNNITNNSTT